MDDDRGLLEKIYDTIGERLLGTDKKRDVSLSGLFEQVIFAFEESGIEGWPVDIVIGDNNDRFVLLTERGRLYYLPFSLNESNDVVFEERQEVLENYLPVAESRSIAIEREGSERVRVVAIVCSAVLNRSGEIDSTSMFDNFVERIERTGEYPYVNALHLGKIAKIAEVDFVARDGYQYIQSYVFDDTELGRAAEKGYLADPDYWGHSIEFDAIKREMIEVAPGISLPVYTDGINTATAILPENGAAAIFTENKVLKSRGEIPMNGNLKDTLLKLLGGDTELTNKVEVLVDESNDEVENERMIARSAEDDSETEETETTEETEETETEDVEETETEEEETEEEETEETEEEEESEEQVEEVETVIDDSVVQIVAEHLLQSEEFIEMITENRDALNGLKELLTKNVDTITEFTATAQGQIDQLSNRLEAVERKDDEKVRERVAAMPKQKRTLLYRPSAEDEDEEDGDIDLGAVAQETMRDWDTGYKN